MSKPICPDDCTSSVPDFNFNPCAPEWNRGEIDTVYLMNVGYPVVANPLTDPAGFIAEMAARVSNTSTNADAIRQLTVIGEKPEPEKNVIKMSGNRQITTSKTHSIMFDIDELSQENRDAQRQIECGNQFLIMWAVDGWLYGGSDNVNDGIPASIVADLITPRDRSALEYIHCVATWEDKFTPSSCPNPLV